MKYNKELVIACNKKEKLEKMQNRFANEINNKDDKERYDTILNLVKDLGENMMEKQFYKRSSILLLLSLIYFIIY